jgi:putative ATP-dependent endonuclease of OLD family
LVTTHSTQIAAKVPLEAHIVLTIKADGTPFAASPSATGGLTERERHDLNRYLDATKSNLLFARKVMLVEGAAEMLLLPPLVKKVMGIDLEREGISVVAVHGAHFTSFARLFHADCLPKACAIVGDADQDVGTVGPDDDVPVPDNLTALKGEFVQIFLGATTFERELTVDANLKMLAAAADDLGAPKLKSTLDLQDFIGGAVSDELTEKVLATAKRFGKGRFAQAVARHADKAGALPQYVIDAVTWLKAQ